MNALSRRALSTYDQVTYDASVDFASQHSLVSLMFRSLLESLSDLERFMNEKNFEGKARSVSKAQGIISGLATTLDFDNGGKLAIDLLAIYDYCNRKLIAAHAKNEAKIVIEIKGILGKLEDAWNTIPPSIAQSSQ